jgi:monovalent cation:proton antiporter-2 (CPA2) family protein
LGSAVISVLAAKRLGLGAIFGYLAAGAALGPWGAHIVENVDRVLAFAEFGIVLLLFIIGLELQPIRLWTMRRLVFGLGGAQVGLTTLVIAGAGLAFGLSWPAALVVAVALSLSSTAFALQILAEKNQLTTRHGRSAFSILLFQDLVAIPVLALLPLLGDSGPSRTATHVAWDVGLVVGAVAAVVIGGRYVLRPILRVVARARSREVFAATALLIVVGTALIVESVGLSMALGAFLAGVLLADSEFRHALEADIEPFKGLLLGLFFVAVGMSVNFGLLATEMTLILLLTAALVAAKFVVLFGLGIAARHDPRSALSLAGAISQGGEFAFVIFIIAVDSGVMSKYLADLLVLVVTLSMAATPAILLIVESIHKLRPDSGGKPYDVSVNDEHQVIIAGFGRYGQIVGRILRAKKIGFTALEISPEQVDFVTKYGAKVHYGDASRLDVLRAARADKAVAFVLAIDDVESSIRAAETVIANFPDLVILARARNRQHAYRLMDLGVSIINRETLFSSLDTARQLLQVLGMADYEAARAVETFRENDRQRLLAQHGMHHDEEKMIADSKAWAKELEAIFEQDAAAEKPDAIVTNRAFNS